MRPLASVAGTRWTRCTPDSNFSLREDAAPPDRRRRPPCSRRPCRRFRQHLGPPALQVGIAQIHAQEIAGEERRLVAAGAGADLEDRRLLVRRVLGDERHADLGLEGLEAGDELAPLLLGERGHVGARRRPRRASALTPASSSLGRPRQLAHQRRRPGRARRARATRRRRSRRRGPRRARPRRSRGGGRGRRACRSAAWEPYMRHAVESANSRSVSREAVRRCRRGSAPHERLRSRPQSHSSSIALTGPMAAGDIDSARKPSPISAMASSGLRAELAAQRHRHAGRAPPLSAIDFSARRTGSDSGSNRLATRHIAAIAGEQELQEVVGADREEVGAAARARRAARAARAPRPWRRASTMSRQRLAVAAQMVDLALDDGARLVELLDGRRSSGT